MQISVPQTDADLLHILLGNRKLSTVLLREFGSLRKLLTATKEALLERTGITESKADKIQAILKVADRYLEETLIKSNPLTSPQLTRKFLTSKLRDQGHEIFVALLLDSQHQVIKYIELAHGTIDGAAVYPREVVKTVLLEGAAAVIFAHNHPSGIAEASQADKAITQRLVKALSLIDVRVLDHLIVGDGEFTSFAEKGWV